MIEQENVRRALAVDIGASSGRHVVGWREGDRVETREVYRFPNAMNRTGDGLVWDIGALEREVKTGIDRALEQYPDIATLSVDTWGVDYVLLRGNTPVLPVFAYRDSRTKTVAEETHRTVPFSDMYRITGCQFQPFNTVYQLLADRKAGRLEGVTDLLMLPEYLMFRLCGGDPRGYREYTNATTTGLVNARTGEYDEALIGRLGLPAFLFPPLNRPGKLLGIYRGIRVILGPTHDTASAVEGIPMETDGLYISSGTWSLLGVKRAEAQTDEESEKANFTNEGGAGYIRYQKNIMGLWLVNELRRELCPGRDFKEIEKMAASSRVQETVEADAPDFLAPISMKEAFDRHLSGRGYSEADYFRIAYRSLAKSYRKAIGELEKNVGRTYDTLYIVGGGAHNGFLNRETAEETGKNVVALPLEATSLGNLRNQWEADA